MKVLSKYIYILLVVSSLHVTCGKSDAEIDDRKEVLPPGAVTLASVSKPTLENITTISAQVKAQVTNKGGALVTNRGVVWSISPNPTIDQNSLEAGAVNGAGEFSVQLTGLTHNTVYYVRAWAENSGGIGYSEEIIFTTAAIQTVTFADEPIFIIGSTLASYDAEIVNNGGGQISERGLCWSVSENPTIADNKLVHSTKGEGKFRCNISGLTQRTSYNLKAYAINEKGVSYGRNISFRTIGKGNVTYTFNKSANPTPEELAVYARLQIAIDSAVWYANNYTSATKHVWVNYATGTPTADANNEGWMRFGTGVGYQNLRTMLHEMNHTFGTGTTNWWTSIAMVGGKYQLQHANAILKLITKDQNATLSGDSQHWWPYGLNQNNEVTSSWDYVYNCLIIEAMRKDGMTSHSGPYLP
ncbi:fibronectin type III domain-containing protein [Sphingobacterium pedocola]|uniref:Fibronectin type-III domain-containing protein n=1 Tax=Sphingobacterium pedocola TaxID=2082722 RepID=A0ABR9TA48_9SPHI|nr:fibronectin type III domain-containing protein [Sphingobacterium pedocola]MBE8722216.1 hypothetical protein [Sphingobacterium pedocola]